MKENINNKIWLLYLKEVPFKEICQKRCKSIWLETNHLGRGALKKKLTKSVKSPKGGEGSAPEIKKSTIQNVDFLIRGGGGHIFSIFPNVNEHFRYFSLRKNKVVLKWFLGNFKCFKPMFLFLRGFPKFKIFPISNFSQLGLRGGIKFPIFPKFKKVQNILG